MGRHKKEAIKYIYTVGRRKRSVARVRLYAGKGQSLINDMPVEDFFKGIIPSCYLKPLEVTQTTGKYYFTVKIVGGGKRGQQDAFVHGLSRGLAKVDPEKFKKILRTNGLLTRDPRERERRKFGLAQGARAAKQSPKR